jgi:hypothetical protein
VIDRAVAGGEKLSDVMADVARMIARAALQAAIMGSGPLAGLFGTGGTGGQAGGLIGALSKALPKLLKANGRSPEMVRRAVQSLGRVFKFAKGRGLAAHNPVAGVEIKSSKRGKARVEIPSKDELRAILAAARGRWRPLIITALFTGLRASELRGFAGRTSTSRGRFCTSGSARTPGRR